MTGSPTSEARVVGLLVLGLLLLTGLIVQPWKGAQPPSRYLLTVAVVDDHSLELDPYEDLLDIDRAEYRGHVYTDKAPYQPLLAAVPFQAYRLAGGDTFPDRDPDRGLSSDGNVGLWWVTLWSCALPAIGFVLVLRRLVGRVAPDVATPVALAVLVGTVMLPFASWLFGHVLAALFVALAWSHLRPTAAGTRSVLLGGVCLGLGIGTEYTVAAVALVLLIDRLLRWERAPIVALCAGTVLGVLPMLVYNWLVFEDPFEVSYQGHLPNFEGEGALGVYNLELPRWEEVTKALVGNRGLFVLTPVVLLAVLGCAWLARRSGPLRRDGVIGLAVLVLMLVLSTGIDGYGGASPGPRYLIPMFAMLAVPLAVVWQWAPRVTAAATTLGAAIMWAASVTSPLIDTREPDALGLWLRWLGEGRWAPNVLTGTSGGWVLVVASALGAGALVGAVAIERRGQAIQ